MASRCWRHCNNPNESDYVNDIQIQGTAGNVIKEVISNNHDNHNNSVGNSDLSNVVLVRITGPDATQKRAKRLPFSHSIYGRTTVSASGIAIRFPIMRVNNNNHTEDDEDDGLYIVTSAHLFAAFRSATSGNSAAPKSRLERTIPSQQR